MGAESLVAAQLYVRGSMLVVLRRCDEIDPLSGVPCFSFYRPRESLGYIWEKREKREAKEVFQGRRVFLFLCAGPADMAGGDRDSSMLGA